MCVCVHVCKLSGFFAPLRLSVFLTEGSLQGHPACTSEKKCVFVASELHKHDCCGRRRKTFVSHVGPFVHTDSRVLVHNAVCVGGWLCVCVGV